MELPIGNPIERKWLKVLTSPIVYPLLGVVNGALYTLRGIKRGAELVGTGLYKVAKPPVNALAVKPVKGVLRYGYGVGEKILGGAKDIAIDASGALIGGGLIEPIKATRTALGKIVGDAIKPFETVFKSVEAASETLQKAGDSSVEGDGGVPESMKATLLTPVIIATGLIRGAIQAALFPAKAAGRALGAGFDSATHILGDPRQILSKLRLMEKLPDEIKYKGGISGALAEILGGVGKEATFWTGNMENWAFGKG